MNESPPVLENPPPSNRIARFAALSSVLTPVIAVFSYLFIFGYPSSHGRETITFISVVGSIAFLLIILGFVLGLMALAITRRGERRGLLGKALVGVFLNGLLLTLLMLPLLTGKRILRTPQERLYTATNTLAHAGNDESRFYALDDAAKESFNAGSIEDASNFAHELLKLAPSFQGNWNYGNAIQDGNLVLGRIAARDGRMDDAKRYLLEAGKSPGSPTMDSFGPNMSLARDLLQKGERDTVLQYFQLCHNFWTGDHGKLNQWGDEVKAGMIPNFGANLVY
jgi:uncharacterized membrane protein YeaQ/YmgE (transglycosylase-associated protein family)